MSCSAAPFASALSALLLLLTAACSRGPQRPFEIIAVLPFEDLSSSPDTRLLGAAASRLAVDRTEGDRGNRVVFSPERREAQFVNATRTISGWYEVRGGQAHIHGVLRDETSGKAVRSFEAVVPQASDLNAFASAIASQTGVNARAVAAPKVEAALAFERSLRPATPAEASSAVSEALQADPGYGAAAVRRVDLAIASGDRTAVMQAIEAAKSARLTEAERARLDLATARLEGSRQAGLAALRRLAELQPANLQTLETLLNLQFEQQDFKGAAVTAGQILEILPSEENTLNRRGYALAFAGDLPGARRAFEEYQKRRPESVNAIDSLGEVLFYFRRYDEAAGLFLEAARRNPATLNGQEPFRAALSYALAGNLKEADAQIAKFWAARKGDPLLALRQGIWARMTGRKADLPPTAPGLATDAMFALRDGDRTRAAQLSAEARKLVRTPAEATLAITASIIAQPSAPPDVWRSRIASAVNNPQQVNLRTELTGWALLLDGHYKEAAEVWRPIFEGTPALTGNDARLLLFWALAAGGNKDEALKVMPEGWLPPAGLEPGLGALFYPKIPDLRTKL